MPVLLQLFVLYYGIASAVRLPAFAERSEAWRSITPPTQSAYPPSAFEAVAKGQLEAARTLELTERQVLTLFVPRTRIPPSPGPDDVISSPS